MTSIKLCFLFKRIIYYNKLQIVEENYNQPITATGLMQSSKTKQPLYSLWQKDRYSIEAENKYKNYKRN